MMLVTGMLAVALAMPAAAQSIRKGKTASGIAYDVQGSGPFLVLLTGSNLDRRMWNREAEWLSKTYTVVRYDLRAHGESDTATTEFTHLNDLAGVLDALKIEKATLIGLSAGAFIALDAALDLPNRVERIVLAGPGVSGYTGKNPPSFPPEMFAAIQAKEYRKVSEILLKSPVFAVAPESQPLVRQMVTENERLWTVDRALMKLQPPTYGRLDQVKVPTLVIVGENDIYQRDHAEVIAAKVPGARLVVVPGGTHIVNMSSPKEFEAAVRAFLPSR
ncbi:MAG TPA: alpha/beta fold hydrolase [Vicinamibacterales bacterium]|nr:alpha/beta fold hydrolase [Vicinamibacterales bacterium]